jgi:hypothetical protein
MKTVLACFLQKEPDDEFWGRVEKQQTQNRTTYRKAGNTPNFPMRQG